MRRRGSAQPDGHEPRGNLDARPLSEGYATSLLTDESDDAGRGTTDHHAYEDPDLTGDCSFALKLPPEEGAVIANLESIERFIMDAWRNPMLGQSAWHCSRKHLTIRAKKLHRLGFIESCIRSARTASRS